MKYVITKIKTAAEYGINKLDHMISEKGEILLNEMEINSNNQLEGTFAERVEKLKGKVFNNAEATDYVITKEFEICSRQQ